MCAARRERTPDCPGHVRSIALRSPGDPASSVGREGRCVSGKAWHCSRLRANGRGCRRDGVQPAGLDSNEPLKCSRMPSETQNETTARFRHNLRPSLYRPPLTERGFARILSLSLGSGRAENRRVLEIYAGRSVRASVILTATANSDTRSAFEHRFRPHRPLQRARRPPQSRIDLQAPRRQPRLGAGEFRNE